MPRPVALGIVAVLVVSVLVPLRADPYKDITLESLLTSAQQTSLGIDVMPAKRRAVLRQVLIDAYVQGFQRGKIEGIKSAAVGGASAPAPLAGASAPAAGGVIESQVDGDFEGWNGETIVKLTNGQIWQQAEYTYEYEYEFMPEVLIYPSGGTWKMKVEGSEEAIEVRRLR